MNRRRTLALASAALSAALAPVSASADEPQSAVEVLTGDIIAQDGRAVPLRLFAPLRSRKPLGVLVFSHGAKSNNGSYDLCLKPWAARGYLVVAPNHLDATPSPPAHDALWLSRVADLQAVISDPHRIERLAARRGRVLDWSRLAAVGHSFGGLTAQALAGAVTTPPTLAAPDRRIKAVACFSPPGAIAGFVPPDAWRPITTPVLVQSGTADFVKGLVDDWRAHLMSAERASSRERWTLVGEGVDHYFGGLICTLKPNAGAERRQLDDCVELAGLFLDAFASGDAGARLRLEHAAATQPYAPLVQVSRLRSDG